MARLIDADKIPYEECYVPDGDIRWGYIKALIAEKAVIDQIPTVDAVPVVHGRWVFHHTTTVEKYDVVKCSNCGHEAFAIAIYVKEGHYCPNCGAKMNLEVE